MSITVSQIITDSAQIDGRRYIRERHTDHLGVTHDIAYLAEAGTNANDIMMARQSFIVERLRQSEIQANLSKALNAELVFTFNHSTVAENRTALRELFKVATKWELMTLGWVINELALSDNQLKLIFEVNDAQLPALKAKLVDISDKYEAALLLVGQ